MLTALALVRLVLAQEPGEDLPVLRGGEAIEDEITDGDPQVHTPTLDKSYTDAPVVGKRFVIEIEESGTYTIELRSYFFDAYLVLRDEAGEVLAEDDDGGIGIHARIDTRLDVGGFYSIEACSLHAGRGAFELDLTKGRVPIPSPQEEHDLELEDLGLRVPYLEEHAPDSKALMRALHDRSKRLRDAGRYGDARVDCQRYMELADRLSGSDSPEMAHALNDMAMLLWSQGDYSAARPLYERALAIDEKVLGPEHPDTATGLNNLALVLVDQGDYSAARPLLERALKICEKVIGPEHPSTAKSLNSLAVVLGAQGDFAAARPLYERALAIDEKVLGPEHPDTATGLNNLATFLQAQGDYAAAQPLLERALAIREKVSGPEHPLTATSLHNLAVLLWAQEDYAAARPLHERALAICEKVLGAEHPVTAMSFDSLARLFRDQGDYAAARPLHERALAIVEKVLGREHPDTATTLDNLALLLRDQGDYTAAGPFLERALAIREKVLGPDHPDTTRSRYNLANLLSDAGFDSQSFDVARQALTSSLDEAELALWALSEKERLFFLRRGERNLNLSLSLALGSAPAARGALAYEFTLAWRGLSSRTLLESRARLQAKAPEGARALIENLHGVQAQLSKVLYATEIPDRERHEREIRALRERRNDLEVELQRFVGPSPEPSVSLDELRRGLLPGSAFLDFLVHPLYEPAEREGEKVIRMGRWTPDHISAWIVRPDRELVQLDLGPSAEVEAAVKRWLGEIVSRRGISTESEAEESGSKLRALLWEPLSKHLEGIARVFVRADSFLGTLPLEVIPLEGGRFLIEEKDFVYVQTPLDLVEREERSSGTSSALLAVGGVDFRKRSELEKNSVEGAPTVASAPLTDELRGHLNHFWSRLPHTENEAQTVSDLFETAFPVGEHLFLSDDAPSEERLKQELPRHAFLHLATHGFFNPEGTVSMWDSAQEATQKDELHGLGGLETETRALVGALPGLLTGLVCAGANEPAPPGRDDGLLTAEEVLWLDLSKVDLVVLSACETALGERRSGEGMIGLRRAFGLAGAKTVVSSLWSVKDRSTSELMQRFYENLWLKKQGRAEALRNAQLEMLAKNRATEGDALPSTWGAFVLSGEWR